MKVYSEGQLAAVQRIARNLKIKAETEKVCGDDSARSKR